MRRVYQFRHTGPCVTYSVGSDYSKRKSFTRDLGPIHRAFVFGSLRSVAFRPPSLRLCSSAPSFGQLLTTPFFRLGLETGIEAVIGTGSKIEMTKTMAAKTRQ